MRAGRALRLRPSFRSSQRWLCDGGPNQARPVRKGDGDGAAGMVGAGLKGLLPAGAALAGHARTALGALSKLQGSLAAAKANADAAQARLSGAVAGAKSSVEGAKATVTGTVATAKSSVDGAKAAVTGVVTGAKSSVEGAKSKLERQATMVKSNVDGAKSGVVGSLDFAKARVRGSVALATGGVDAAKARLAEMANVKQALPPAVESMGAKLGVPPNVLRVVGQGLGMTRNVAVLAARTAEPLAMRAIARVLPKDKADALRKTLDQSVGMLSANGRNLYQRYKLYIHATIGLLAFAWIVQKVLKFVGRFVHTLESLAVYLIYIGTGLFMVMAVLFVRGRYSLSARKAHDRAAHLVAQSAEPVILEKLGNKIKRTAGNQRIVTRSGGEWKLKWPQAQAKVAVAASKVGTGAGETASTEVVVGTQEKMPELIVQIMDTAAMKAAVKCASPCFFSALSRGG